MSRWSAFHSRGAPHDRKKPVIPTPRRAGHFDIAVATVFSPVKVTLYSLHTLQKIS